jgi:hypothetical protein
MLENSMELYLQLKSITKLQLKDYHLVTVKDCVYHLIIVEHYYLVVIKSICIIHIYHNSPLNRRLLLYWSLT